MSEAVNVMDGKCVKVKSKSDTRCNDGVDRISQLPDDIIACILSNLLLRDAARTSVLSTRWYDLWRYITTLDLRDRSFLIRVFKGESSWDEERGKYTEWVNSIVEKHKAHSLKKIVIYYKLEKSFHSAITKWLEFAFSKRVEVMELVFPYDAKENAVVLDELLKLRPSNLLKSSNLRSLHLTSLKVSGEAIKLILRDCHLLERLMIDNADFTSDIEVCGGATGLVLKHLNIRICSGGKSIKVSAPNLTYLGIDVGGEMLLVENVPKLVEVRVYGGCDISCFTPQLQILTISFRRLMELSAKGVPTMPKLTELIVNYHGRSKYLLPSLTPLIRASPLLRTFNLHFLKPIDEDEEDMEIVNVEAFKHCNLRVFMFSGFHVDAADHVELVSYILDNCVALRKLYIKVYETNRNLRAMREADMEKAKQLLQPKIPTHIQLQVI